MNFKTMSRSQSGMMLLEVLIAILIFSIGVLGMVKMQAVSTANSVNSEDRATAALLANDLVSELWAVKSLQNPATFKASNADYTTWVNNVSTTTRLRGASGSMTVSGASNEIATITITWKRQLGGFVDSSAPITSSDSQAKATYTTQVAIQ